MNLKATRRRFFALAGASPLAAKAAANKAIAEMSGIQASGLGYNGQGLPSSSGPPTPEQFRIALLNPFTRRVIEDILYEQEHLVGRLDVDIASYRSFSLAAKITFQRQRNVERRIKEMKLGHSYDRMFDVVKKALGF